MIRIFCLLLFLSALRSTCAASQQQFVPWQSIIIQTPKLEIVGVVTVEVSKQSDAYHKFSVTAFGRAHVLSVADLKRLEGFPLSGLTLLQEPGYTLTGGYTLYLNLERIYYGDAKTLQTRRITISIQKDSPLKISELEPR